MKQLTALLLVCLLLCGCGRHQLGTETTLSELESSESATTATSSGLYEAESAIEARTEGAVRAYRLATDDAYGMLAFGENLLLFSGTETTTLTLLTGEDLHIAASTKLEGFLSHQDPSLRIHGNAVSYYKESTGETVVLDSSLKEVSRIAAPEGLSGKPILSEDRNTLFYCTADAVHAWDLEENIRRTLKEMAYSQQTLQGLHMQDTVLQSRILDGNRERSLFLSTQNGQLLWEQTGSLVLTDRDGRYYASFPSGMGQTLVFGSTTDPAQALMPKERTCECVFLERMNGAVTISAGSDPVRLDYYELTSGLRRASLSLDPGVQPVCMEDTQDCRLYILTGEAIYRWDFAQMPLTDKTAYTAPHYTADTPDLDGLAQCRIYANEIGQRHGIRVLIWRDALQVQPWDYDFEAEHVVSILQEELKLLDQRLSQYPDGFLTATASPFSSLTISIVRQIAGTAESGSLDTATGIQFLDGSDAYVVLAAGAYSERTLYHELFHVMETYIWNESIAFDQWNKLNPSGFQYDYDYAANAQRDSGVYLQRENRAFVDTYSMSYPKEDRARIMEYAMLPGNKELFQHEIMQRKLQALCSGIREAYHLEKTEEAFLWEQYLE